MHTSSEIQVHQQGIPHPPPPYYDPTNQTTSSDNTFSEVFSPMASSNASRSRESSLETVVYGNSPTYQEVNNDIPPSYFANNSQGISTMSKSSYNHGSQMEDSLQHIPVMTSHHMTSSASDLTNDLSLDIDLINLSIPVPLCDMDSFSDTFTTNNYQTASSNAFNKTHR